MPSDKNLNQLVINEIESGEIFEKMKESNLLNDDELYLVREEEGEELVLGDMVAAVYDPQKKQQDIFKYVDDAIANIEPGSGGGSGEIVIPENVVTTEGGAELLIGKDFGEGPYIIRFTEEEESGGSGGGNGNIYVQPEEPEDASDGAFWIDTDEDEDDAFYNKGEIDALLGGISFNGRKGAVVPQSGDYTAEMVGAAPAGYAEGRKQDGVKDFFQISAATGWHRIATANHAFASAIMRITANYSSGFSSDLVCLVNAYGRNGGIECLHYRGSDGQPPDVSDVRCVKMADGKYAIDVYQKYTRTNYWTINFINTGATVTTTENAEFVIQIPTFIAEDDTLPDGESLVHAMEFLNPPMRVGEEYRTTERYLGKPVYVKAFKIESADMPTEAGGTAGEEHGTTIAVFDISGVVIPAAQADNAYYRYTLPTSDGAIIPISNSTMSGVKRVTVGSYSNYKAIIVKKYIKTTD